MKKVEIKAFKREDLGKKATKELRKQGSVPSVLYGGEEVVHFYTSRIDFDKLLYTADVHLIYLAAKEQELYQFRDELRMQFSEEEQVMLRRIQHSITDFLKVYNQNKGYQVIMSGTFGGPLLYGHPAIDITKDVLVGLNIEYQKSRPAKK